MSQGMIFVLAIIIVATIGGILKARYGYHSGRREDDIASRDEGETQRLKEEVRALKDRLQVLERITVEKESSLNREIDSLRDR